MIYVLQPSLPSPTRRPTKRLRLLADAGLRFVDKGVFFDSKLQECLAMQ